MLPGLGVPPTTLALLSSCSVAELVSVLQPAAKAGTVSINGKIRFIHDRWQQAAYQLIGPSDRLASVHFQVASTLHKSPDVDQDTNIFESELPTVERSTLGPL